ncbi:MAG: hypothetical protein ACRD3S_06965, partial [Terracidiphilus sp.]
MRKWVVLLLIWGAAWPAFAAKNLSVDQMEQLLNTLRNKPDGKAAAELDEAQLTERVGPTRLERWKAEFPGPKMREKLVELADISAFLDPPASDVVSKPQPDNDEQNRILRLAVQYVESTFTRLPDFFATRETAHYEDTLAQHAASTVQEGPAGSPGRGLNGAGGPGARGVMESISGINLGQPGSATSTVFSALHLTDIYDRTVTYRGGHEVIEEAAREPQKGLVTHGEFGSILAGVLVDALRNQLVFTRWEQGANGPEVVFHYRVPASASHFRVGFTSGGNAESVNPAYHGEIAIDPDSGVILRFSEIAEMAPPYQAMRASISVDYAPVTIAGHSYICPVRAIAYSRTPVPTVGAADTSMWPVQAELNDIAFKDYHEFRTQTRMITNPTVASDNNVPAGIQTAPPESPSSNAATAPGSAPASAPPATASPASEMTATVPSNAAPVANPAEPVAPPNNPAASSASESSSAPAPGSAVNSERETAANNASQPTPGPDS